MRRDMDITRFLLAQQAQFSIASGHLSGRRLRMIPSSTGAVNAKSDLLLQRRVAVGLRYFSLSIVADPYQLVQSSFGFGARFATSFSKRASPRSGSQSGESRRSP